MSSEHSSVFPPGITLSVLIKISGLTIHEVADVLGVTEGVVSAWSSRKRKIPPDRVKPLADALQRKEAEVRPLVVISRGRARSPRELLRNAPRKSAIA